MCMERSEGRRPQALAQLSVSLFLIAKVCFDRGPWRRGVDCVASVVVLAAVVLLLMRRRGSGSPPSRA